MKVTITTQKNDDMEVNCTSAKFSDGFLVLNEVDNHKQVLISVANIKMIVVD